MKTKNFPDLLGECVALMRNVGYSQKSIEAYISVWDRKMKPFMDAQMTEFYSVEIGEAFLSSLPEDVMQTYNRLRRSVTILNSVLETNTIKRYVPQKQVFEMEGEIGHILQDFLSYKREHRVSVITLDVYTRMLGRFLIFLKMNNIETLSSIEEQHLLDFIASSQVNKSQRVGVIRGLCYYLVERKLVPHYFGTLIKGFRFPQREKLPSVYTKEEIALIGKAINKNEFGGKRLYATFMLASRLGLRTSDIINLKFENIDWDKNTINIVQQKTRKNIELPLTSEVGNAIIDYLKNEREMGKSNYLFITLKPPFEQISRDTLYVGLQTAIHKSKIHIEKRRHGMHSMRHSLASKLLIDGRSLPVISSVLGHSSTQSTMNYLRINLDGMKKCLLEVPQVPDSFYTQRGGIFYE